MAFMVFMMVCPFLLYSKMIQTKQPQGRRERAPAAVFRPDYGSKEPSMATLKLTWAEFVLKVTGFKVSVGLGMRSLT